jgi:hypothetical protein
MDGLSSAANVIAVISIAAQLLDGVQKLHVFWKNVVDAPSHILALVEEIRLLKFILCSIHSHLRFTDPDLISIITESLKSCRNKIDELNVISSQLESGLKSKNRGARKLSAFRWAFQDPKIERLSAILSEAKITLILALQAAQK